MKDILQEIVAHKRREVAQQKQAISTEQLRQQAEACLFDLAPRRSMKAALAASPTGIIAEFKRRSPSKGWIAQTALPRQICPAYEQAGAAALSILTDERFFGGTLRDIRTVRELVNIPILRKEFIIDEYQLLQARIVGADAVLLIAACLSLEACNTLTTQAHRLGLEVLLEIHSEAELAYANGDADMVGINNRHLGSFVTDVETSFRMAASLEQSPAAGSLLVSESGISRAETIEQLRAAGYRGFLIGETLMRTEAPAQTLRELVAAL
jgi:indole-3-glycerol phosphate synthase